MDAREIVCRAIEFREPSRVPIWFTDDVIMPGEPLFSHVESVTYAHLSGWTGQRGGVDDWGCVWTPIEATMGQVSHNPLASWDGLAAYRFPDPTDERRFAGVAEQIGKARAAGRYVAATVPFTLFERIHFLHGFTNTLEDLCLQPERICDLADRVLEVQIGFVHEFASRGADGVFFTDDWGTQKALFIRPAVWREVFKPRYRKLFDEAHRLGLHTMIHSDGEITEIIDDWIGCGLDVLNIMQANDLGIDRIGRLFAGKVCFSCTVDIQTTLVHGTVEDVVEETKHLLKSWGDSRGGCIATGMNYHTIQIDPAKIRAMFQAFLDYGQYPMSF